MKRPLTFLCICTYFKGAEFLRSCKAEGNNVILMTARHLEHKPWPWDAIDETLFLDNNENTYDVYQTITNLIADFQRTKNIDRIVSLDDFDVEKGALLREHFRIPGMGQTTARYFRDKLAMRVQAQSEGIKVPVFSSLFNDVKITEYLQNTAAPMVIKPRSEASATGIKKVYSFDEAWNAIHGLGEQRHNYLIEQFKPGDVYHIDSLTLGGKIIFTQCSQYLNTPFEVAHGGGIFRSVSVAYNSADEKALKKLNTQVMQAFGMQFSASHTEAIKCHEDGQFYFLETASRVGGAHLAEMIEAATTINLWREWAKIETAVANGTEYILPKTEKAYSGIIITLSNQEWPDYQVFNDEEIVWKMNEAYHIGLIVKATTQARVLELLDKYASMIYEMGLHASAPAPDKPTH
jgi:biotin carboxylase